MTAVMPIIRPEGLLKGERIAQLSDQARMLWPFLYAASNGYGRFEIDYLTILDSAFKDFHQKPSESVLASVLREYRDADLLFVYEVGNTVWGAWDSCSGQRYFNKADEASPAPPEPAFTEWRQAYLEKKRVQESALTAAKGTLGKAILSTSRSDSQRSNQDFDAQNAFSTSNHHNTTQTHVLTQHVKENTSLESSELPDSAQVPEPARTNVLEMRRSPQIEQVTSMPLAVNGSPPSAAYGAPLRPFPDHSPPDATCELWCETRYIRHRKKNNKTEAIPKLRMIYRDPAKRRLFEKNHELWCETVDWRKENGRYCPSLDKWIDNDGYVDAPDDNEAAVSKPGKTGSEIE